MSPKTQAILNEMIAHAAAGGEIIPAHFQPFGGGISNCVSAAVRIAKAQGLLVDAGLDGVGNRKYRAPVRVVPAPTHAGPRSIN